MDAYDKKASTKVASPALTKSIWDPLAWLVTTGIEPHLGDHARKWKRAGGVFFAAPDIRKRQTTFENHESAGPIV